MFRHDGRLWMCYRFHRMDVGGRCGTAIVEIDDRMQPLGKSQHLKFSGPTATEHFEDARLFNFRGEPYISYTMMSGYKPGVDYKCVMRYARLAYTRKRWQVVDEWQPVHGHNNGLGKEKNWVFFEHEKKLFCIYASYPEHVVLQIEGDRVVATHKSGGPEWHWGEIRGGTQPVLIGDRYVTIFHSSLATEVAPHFVRYYAGAYTFEAKPPFRPIEISEFPVLSGSEEDGHQVDPRYVEGWKPYVVFPCGLVQEKDRWLVSFGINDWQCAIANLSTAQLQLGPADGSGFKPRFYRTPNGSLPVQYNDGGGAPQFLRWEVFKPGRNGTAGVGYMRILSPREAIEVSELPGVEVVDEHAYIRAKRDTVTS